MSNNMESPNSEPLERDGGAEAVTSIPDSSSVEHAVSPLLKRRRFGTTEEPHEDESNDDEDDPDGFKPYTPSSSPQFLYRNPSSSFRSVFKPLSKTFLYCHSHTPRPQVPLFFVKGLSASAVQATVATAPKATSPDEKGMKPQWKAIDFKWIRENKDDVAWYCSLVSLNLGDIW